MFIINIVKNIKNMNEPVSVVILAQLQFDMKHTSKPAALEVEQKKKKYILLHLDLDLSLRGSQDMLVMCINPC